MGDSDGAGVLGGGMNDTIALGAAVLVILSALWIIVSAAIVSSSISRHEEGDQDGSD